MNKYKVKILSLLENKYISLIVIVVLDCLIMILNKYPILYSDSSTYISSGFELETPFDRPIVYGILLRIMSLNGVTLLLVPICQSLIFTYLLYQILTLFFKNDKIMSRVLIFSILQTIACGFNWTVNQLLPDFFSTIGFLSLICLLFKDSKPFSEWPLYLVLFISTSSHISNLLVYISVFVLILVGKKKFLPEINKMAFGIKSFIVAFLMLLSYLIMMSAISKSKDVFYAGSLAQKGILQAILKEKCPEQNFKLCAYKDSIPESFDYFVWNQRSPLYVLGGWKENRTELKKINAVTFTASRYLIMQLKASFLFFLKQLIMFDIGEGNGAFDENTVLIKRIQKYVPLDAELCVNSEQSKEKFLHLSVFRTYLRMMMLIFAIVFIFLLISRYKHLEIKLQFFILLSLSLLILSAAQIAFSSEISNRHGCKLTWLIVLLDFILITKLRYLAANDRTEKSQVV